MEPIWLRKKIVSKLISLVILYSLQHDLITLVTDIVEKKILKDVI